MRSLWLAAALAAVVASAAEPPKLLRSLSGPSGKTVGNQFQFDEVRNRFVFPNDGSLVIYFEWEAPPGDHTLTGVWKQPNGSVASISADVKVQTTTNMLSCYWIFNLEPHLANGIWTLEVRVDGQPAGSHPFEIVGMEPAARQPTTDQIFKSLGPSLVWVRKVDDAGRKSDAATGFVIEPNHIATAFQSIDSAKKLELEFSDGRKIGTDRIVSASRTGDWAVLEADTRSLPAFQRGDPKAIPIGGRLLAFNVDSGVRIIGGVDIGGQTTVAGFGGRIQLAPAVPPDAIGGPLMDSFGRVVGILGGSVTPGVRVEQRAMKTSLGLSTLSGTANSATSVTEIPQPLPASSRSLEDLLQDGMLTPVLTAMPEFLYGGTAANLPKRADAALPPDSSEFSPKDTVNVYSYWKRQGKISKGELSAKIYDAANRIRGAVEGKKITLQDVSTRFSFGFSPGPLGAGVYRIDMLWDGRPVWRTYIRITE